MALLQSRGINEEINGGCCPRWGKGFSTPSNSKYLTTLLHAGLTLKRQRSVLMMEGEILYIGFGVMFLLFQPTRDWNHGRESKSVILERLVRGIILVTGEL
jgi:hypothetical protein